MSGSFVENYKSLTPKQVKGLNKDTQNLIKTQRELIETLKNMGPALKDGKEILDTFKNYFGDDQDIYITNEIIHNPQVNDRLHEMNIKFLEGDIGKKDYSPVEEGDVVILPAFGATIQEMQFLDAKDAKIVDTTCPWVSKVWNAVDSHR